MTQTLADTIDAYGLALHAFVLMSNHFHLIASTPENNLDKAMHHFMRESSRQIGQESGRINHVFGGPYYWCLIENPSYFSHAYKYVYRNPVDAGICKSVEEYPYSTLRAEMGYADYSFDLKDLTRFHAHVPGRAEERLKWLNKPLGDARKELIRRALRRKTFAFSKQRSLRPLVESLNNPEF